MPEENPVSNQVESQRDPNRERVEADRGVISNELFWHRHGTNNLTLEQLRDLTKFPDLCRSITQMFSGEFAGGSGATFEYLDGAEQQEAARLVLQERNLENAIDAGASQMGIQMTIARAGLDMAAAMEAMQRAQAAFAAKG